MGSKNLAASDYIETSSDFASSRPIALELFSDSTPKLSSDTSASQLTTIKKETGVSGDQTIYSIAEMSDNVQGKDLVERPLTARQQSQERNKATEKLRDQCLAQYDLKWFTADVLRSLAGKMLFSDIPLPSPELLDYLASSDKDVSVAINSLVGVLKDRLKKLEGVSCGALPKARLRSLLWAFDHNNTAPVGGDTVNTAEAFSDDDDGRLLRWYYVLCREAVWLRRLHVSWTEPTATASS